MKNCISIFLAMLIILVLAACGQDTNGAGELTSEPETGTQRLVESSVEKDIGNATENGTDSVTSDYYMISQTPTSNPVVSKSTLDSTLLQSISVTSESQIEVNATFEDNVGSAGHLYHGEKLISENPEDITFLSFYKVDFSSFDDLRDLSNLTRIDFFSCTFAAGIALPEMESVEHVLLSGYNLKSLDILVNCVNIKHLQVMYSDIDDLGILSRFQNLEVLNLTGNRVTKPLNLEPLSTLTNLEVLDLVDGNETIESLKPLYALNKLIFIQVRKFSFDSLPQEDTEHFKDILLWD